MAVWRRRRWWRCGGEVGARRWRQGRWRSHVRCGGGCAACGALRAVPRRSCRVLLYDCCAACEAATVVSRAVERLPCHRQGVVPGWSCCVRLLRRPCRMRLRRPCPMRLCDSRATCAAATVVPPVEPRALCSLELLGAPWTPRAAHVELRVHLTASVARRPLDAARRPLDAGRRSCRVRCLDGCAAHGAETLVPRLVPGRSYLGGRAACGCDGRRVRCCDGCAAATMVVPQGARLYEAARGFHGAPSSLRLQRLRGST